MTGKDQVIAAIQQKMESAKESILRLPNVVGIGVGLKRVRGKPTDELAIVVFVRVKPPEIKDADRIPGEIDGVKTDVFEVGEVVPHANKTRIRPAPGGVSVGNATSLASMGTYGCLLETTMEPNRYILSNNHVIANSNIGSVGNFSPQEMPPGSGIFTLLHTGDPILQPAPADGGSLLDEVGKLYRFPLLAVDQVVDCAIARTKSTTLSDATNRAVQLDGFAEAHQIPGWFGTENQGGGIAAADISGNGRPDLIVFHIDHPGGGNAGFYRIGWDLDNLGKVTGGWTTHMPVPGWFGTENQGGGIAVADISGKGGRDLVVFHIDHPGGGNAGFYRIGWNLDAAGIVTGGWTAPISIPGWFGTENQGGGIAVADISGKGGRDLVVFHIDHPGGGNAGFYRIGWNLDTAGIVTGGWTAPIPVPGWFGHETQGAGIAVADVNGDAVLELVVCHVDNPTGAAQAPQVYNFPSKSDENSMYYRVERGAAERLRHQLGAVAHAPGRRGLDGHGDPGRERRPRRLHGRRSPRLPRLPHRQSVGRQPGLLSRLALDVSGRPALGRIAERDGRGQARRARLEERPNHGDDQRRRGRRLGLDANQLRAL